MRVVHVTPFYGEQYGGSERYVHNLVKHQAKEHEVHVFSTTRYLENTGTTKQDGYTLHRSYSPASVWNINPISFILHKLAHFEADIVHVHSYLYFTSNQAILSKRINCAPILLHLHGGIGIPPYRTSYLKKGAKLFYDRFIGNYMTKKADLIASVSKVDILRATSVFGNNYENKFVHIPNGVDTNQFKPRRSVKSNQTADSVKILYVGDIEPWKGINYLIDTIKRDHFLEGNEIEFQFVGQGSLAENLANTKVNYGTINYFGERNHDKIPDIMRAADIFLFPSFWEGFPTVILEAMSTGLPVVTTPVGDVPLIIKNRENGLIFKPKGTELKNNLEMLIEDQELSTRISKNASRFIKENYSFEKIARRVEKVYDSIAR